MRALVIGERMNLPEVPGWAEMIPARWVRLSLRLGAFRDRVSRAKLASVGVDVASCDSMNLVCPAPQGVGWDAAAARRSAEVLTDQHLPRCSAAYLCGLRVARAFGVRGRIADLAGKTAGEIGGCRLVVLPHPSGLNLWWNDPRNVRRLRRCLSSDNR